MHFDCYRKASTSIVKVNSLGSVTRATVSTGASVVEFDPLNYVRSSTAKHPIFMKFEVYHPLSTFAISRCERLLPILEHNTGGYQIALSNFQNKTPTLYEPNSIVLPLSEFRLLITLYVGAEQPHTFEFWVDFSDMKLSETKMAHEISFVCFFLSSQKLS